MQVKAINESYLPKVDLIGSVQHEDPSIFNEQTIGAFGVSVTWNIFGSNQRSYEKQKIIASKRATVFEKRNLENEISNNESYYNNQINKIKLQWSQNVKDLKEAKNVVRSEKKRYSKGKSTLSDLIEAELLVQELEISIALAPYQLLSAWAGYSANNGKIEIPNGLK
jgi:outer membrane protein TolC